jgi:hypothetical protein
MIIRGATLISRLAVIFAVLFTFSACGGGGGGSSFYQGTDNNDTPSMSFSLLDPQGNSTNTVTSSAVGTLKVTVSGKGTANVVVAAETDVGTLLPASALTDSNGVATFQLQIPPGTANGAGTISATAATNGGDTTSTFGFQVGVTGLRLGYFDSNGDFIENAISIEPESTLASQGSAQLSVAIVDEFDQLVSTAESVSFSSSCLSSGLATLDPINPIISVNGQVLTTYSAKGCVGTDQISAATVGASAQAFGSVTIASAAATGLAFVSAEPTTIAVRGTGGASQRTESSQVTFKVVAASGLPLQGVRVNFALTTTQGGLSVSPSSAVSTNNGTVRATVTAGDEPAVVSVIASTVANDGTSQDVATISDAITVTPGLPVQNSISLSLAEGEGYVVTKGMTVDGVQRTFTVRMSDMFGLPVPNGTIATFTTEYGAVDSSCKTGVKNGARITGVTTIKEGECSVLWTSEDPRVPTLAGDQKAVQTILNNPGYSCKSHNGKSGPCPDNLGYTNGGRSTVLVTAVGQESFVDRNSNGIMDPDEKNLFTNVPEAFLDNNEDGAYTPYLCDPANGPVPSVAQCRAGSEESYIDFNSNGSYDLNNDPAVYNGPACPTSGNGVYCSRELVNVRADEVLILSAPDLDVGQIWDIILVNNKTVIANATGTQEGVSYKAYISDLYNGRPPAGSTVTVSAGGGCTLVSAPSFIVNNSSDFGAFTVDAVETAGDGVDGTISITLQPAPAPSPAGVSAPYTETFKCTSLPTVDPCVGASPLPPECTTP